MISSKFDFSVIEKKIYNFWLKKNYFNPDFFKKTTTSKVFSIVIPPPNITGRLHIGHALNNTIQDIIVRFKRMQGYQVLWVPGTDHAGIATQTVVKKLLDSQKQDYKKLGREKFVQKIWEWKETYGDIILEQIKALGSSCDWSRTKFTMQPELVYSVNYAFKKLYEDNLIYQGERIVNWCPVDQTALSDDEVEKQESGEPGFLYDITYPIIGEKKSIVVSTTRPETMFGDTAVAVHPEDNRYKSLIGKKALIPLANRAVPIIADDYVKMDFGTGCLKITPAHDPNDFEIGKRHNLDFINVMNEKAEMNEKVPEEFQGLNRYVCRKKIIKTLKEKKLFIAKREKMIPLGRSYRSKEIIEYRLSKQWFIRMKPLAKLLLKESEKLNFYPNFYKKIWFYWLENINDWCISRQIWWGHQIPVWYNKHNNAIAVDTKIPEIVKNNPQEWIQEKDVLDTWFSSALWPLTTMGWPNKNSNDFKIYFPTSTLSTAKDIIFFWVIRMCLFSLYFEKKLPFTNIYFHPTVMDAKGKVMSKSKGNGIDPFQVINGANVEDLKKPVLDARPNNAETMLKEIEEKYPKGFIGVGADALRFTLIYLCSNKQFIHLSLDKFIQIGRRFTNKMWNAARLILLELENLDEKSILEINLIEKDPSNYDHWMSFQINQATKKVISSVENYDFSHLGLTCYELMWNDFCDWYLEFIKSNFKSTNKIISINNALVILKKLLIVLHPITPFITEEINHLIFSKLKHLKSTPLIITPFLKIENDDNYSTSIIEKITLLKKIITQLRAFKKENNIQENEKVDLFFKTESTHLENLLTKEKKHLVKIGNFLSVNSSKSKLDKALLVLADEIEFYLVSQKQEITNLNSKKETTKLQGDIAYLEKKLSNPNFLKKGNPQVISQIKEKLNQKKEKLTKLSKS